MSTLSPDQVPAAEQGLTQQQCNEMLPLVRAIAAELSERREIYSILMRRRAELARAATPEGLNSAIAELDACLWDQEQGILRACRELASNHLSLHTLSPIIVHFPHIEDDAVYCWREDEPRITHEHARGSNSGEHCSAIPYGGE